MINIKSILAILFFLIINGTYAQILEKIPLSRQDSALIEKYSHNSNQQLKLKNFKEASDFYNQTAMIYWEHNHFDKAVTFYQKSLEINTSLGNENGIAMINSNLALLYADMKKYNNALEMFTKTYSVRKAKGEKVGTISALINMSVVLNNLKKYDNSIKNLKEALDIAREMSDVNQMKSCYGMLSETYEKYGKADSAFYYFNYYKSFNDLVHEKKLTKTRQELENERLRAQLAETEKTKKELELYKNEKELQKTEKELAIIENEKGELLENLSKKELQIQVTKKNTEIERLKNTQELNKRKQIIIIIFGIAGFLAILTILLFYFNNQKKLTNKKLLAANRIIKLKNNDIISSLNYAKRLQNTMLKNADELSELIGESFIIYEPKDIVGGDFYWFTKIDDKIILAAIDCTGHGVPGAFLTIISNNLLNQIVNKDKLLDPSQILLKMDEGIIEVLDQRNTENNDGMAVGITVFDKQKCIYAGAANKLNVSHNNKVKTYKGFNYGIGGTLFEEKNPTKPFQNHEIPLEKGMTFYLSSDGYPDQFGGEKHKKLGNIKFIQLIESISNKTIKDQKNYLTNYFNEWKGSNDQIDDVLIIGIKVKQT